jgi:hypothetical protein
MINLQRDHKTRYFIVHTLYCTHLKTTPSRASVPYQSYPASYVLVRSVQHEAREVTDVV